jgi:hypothetical protein
MFHIEAGHPRGVRLVADTKLSSADFDAVARQVGVAPFTARKIGFVSARTAERDERVETRWNGKETANIARPGDRIVTNLDAQGMPLVDIDGHHNIYVIKADAFAKLYELADAPNVVPIYHARGTVQAIALAGGFEILAPWGETQRADRGYLILNGADVYGNNAETFETTYERVDG